MKATIVNSGRFPGGKIHLMNGDVFTLSHNGRQVHQFDITKTRSVTMWACIQIGDLSVGYMIGGDDLLEVLKETFRDLS